MAYQSAYGSSQHSMRDSFGRRYLVSAAPAQRGVSRTLFVSTLVAAVLFAAWSGATTFYLVFRDDILNRLALGQSETSRAQDAQIAALTAEIERLRSTKFVDQEKIEQQLSDLSRIQRVIDARQNALSALTRAVTGNPDITGSIPMGPQLPAAPNEPHAAPKPRPLSDTFLVDPPLARSASIQSRIIFPRATADGTGKHKKRGRELATAASALTKLGAQQAQALNAIESDLDQRAARTKRAVAALGIRPPATTAARATSAPVGGPFVPYAGVPEDAFMRQVFRIRLAMEEQERLTRELDGLPVLLPVIGPAEITSGFGPRLDPFLKRLAIHAGVDLRGDTGDPVRATAAGTVITAERHRAYGLMVEVDHGNGLSTRYAHLSAILVKEGAKVPAGAIVGKIGSTGRSTAPHLHYEVRLHGDAVDPRRYLRAAKQLAGVE